MAGKCEGAATLVNILKGWPIWPSGLFPTGDILGLFLLLMMMLEVCEDAKGCRPVYETQYQCRERREFSRGQKPGFGTKRGGNIFKVSNHPPPPAGAAQRC